MIFRIFWTVVALDIAAALTLWALFEPGLGNGFIVLAFVLVIATALIAACFFLALRSDTGRIASLTVLILPTLLLVFGAGANVRSRIWVGRHSSGDSYFSGPGRELAHAMTEHDAERVKELIPAAGDLNRAQGEGTTLLQFGILQADDSDRSLEMVRSLLSSGGDLRRDTSPLALSHAIAVGPRLTKLLLDAGASPNVLDEEHRPVWLSTISASHDANPELLRLFLDHGADVQWRDKAGRGPVVLAVGNNCWRSASLLIEHGASWRQEQMQGVSIPQSLASEIVRVQEYGTSAPEDMHKLLDDLRNADPQAVPHIPAPPASAADGMVRMLDEVGLDKPKENDAVLARLAQQPDWVQRAAAFLDPKALSSERWKAAFLLTLKPEALDEAVQEQCWMLVREELAGVDPPATAARQGTESVHILRLRNLAAIAQGLAPIAGPARERHRADFEALRGLVEQYRKVRHPDASKLPSLGATTR
jgi:hypothetical protein